MVWITKNEYGMNGESRLLVDTNMLIVLLDGNQLASEMLQDKLLYYSFITEIELPGLQ